MVSGLGNFFRISAVLGNRGLCEGENAAISKLGDILVLFRRSYIILAIRPTLKQTKGLIVVQTLGLLGQLLDVLSSF